MARRKSRSAAGSSTRSLLAQATRALGGTLDLDRLLGRLTELALASVGADAAGTWLLLEGDGTALILEAGHGFRHSERIARVPHTPGHDVLGWITDRPGPLVLRSLSARARPHIRRWLADEELGSFIGVPLVGEAAPLGMLGLFRRGRRPFTRADLARAQTLCLPAAPAIVNARLYADQTARAERSAVLLAIAETVGATLDLPAALDAISRRAARALAAERCTVALWPDGVAPLDASAGEAQAARSRRPVERDDGLLVVPIVRKGEVIGTMTLSARGRRRWERSGVDLAAAIAGQIASFADRAAVARVDARLYTDAQQALSDLRAMQQRVVQGETLRALGELASGAAHHLNNLLTIVVGRIQLLRRTATDERARRSLEAIERAAKDGAEVVRRLQQFAGMRRAAERRAVDLNDVVTEALEMTRERWQDHARTAGLTIVAESRLSLLPPIAGDATALRELLTNLILNSVDAMPAGGRITVETRREGAHAVLSVTDTGRGMTEDVRRRAHEPFFTTKGVKSTGLGLSVSYGIARRHGGELTIESQEGRGTTVLVRLPVPGAADAAAPQAPAVRRRALHVLLVDDEADVRLALAEMLAVQGHTVTPAGNGEDALRLLDADVDIDLVLTDLVMPAMTGWEVAAAVKTRRPTLAVGVITGWGDLPEAVAGPRAAVDFIISKPVNLEELAEAVARVGGG